MNFEAVELRTLTFKKNALGGFRQTDVNDFLRNVADDYEIYDERIRRLIEEKEELEAKLTTEQTSQNRLTQQQENEKKELQKQIQHLEQTVNQLRREQAELEQFKQLQLTYQDISKMKRIAQQTLQAAETAANKLLNEAERKKEEVLAAAEQQKQTLMDQAEEERLQNLFSSKLEISALQKELEDQEQLVEQKQQELQQLRAAVQKEIKTFAGMMAETRQEIIQEYTNSIDALTKKNEALRQETKRKQSPAIHVWEQEKEVM